MTYAFVKIVASLSLVAVLAGCSSLAPGEIENPQEPSGPGILTDDSGEFSVTEFFSDERKNKGGGYYILDLKGAPPMTEEEFKEFESFRAWLQSRESGTTEYKEYEEWRAFQQYRQQKATKP